MKIKKECEVCKRPFEVLPCHSKKRTCSHKCGAQINPAAQRDPSKWHVVVCETCGRKLYRRKRRKPKHVFCSHLCKSRGSHIWVPDVVKRSRSGAKVGYYVSVAGERWHYDSSYELRRMKELDYVEKNVVSWRRCDFSIPWIDEFGKEHSYHPDFQITWGDGTVTIEEIKGRMTDSDVRKMTAAVPFCRDRGWKYVINQCENVLELPLPMMKSYTNEFGNFIRPSEETVFIKMAVILAARSTCLRKKVAAVFTDAKMHRVLCFGYNGNVAGGPNQCDSLQEGACGCTHAEINALTKNVDTLEGSTCFLTLSPCLACAKVLINRGVKRLVYLESYRNASGLSLCRQHGLEVQKFENTLDETDISSPTHVNDLPSRDAGCCQTVSGILIASQR